MTRLGLRDAGGGHWAFTVAVQHGLEGRPRDAQDADGLHKSSHATQGRLVERCSFASDADEAGLEVDGTEAVPSATNVA
jgi:hypothetical protein